MPSKYLTLITRIDDMRVLYHQLGSWSDEMSKLWKVRATMHDPAKHIELLNDCRRIIIDNLRSHIDDVLTAFHQNELVKAFRSKNNANWDTALIKCFPKQKKNVNAGSHRRKQTSTVFIVPQAIGALDVGKLAAMES